MRLQQLLGLSLVRLEWAILVYFVLVNSFYAVLLVAASREMWRHIMSVRGENRWRILGSPAAPRISILAPAYNEAATIEDSIRSLLALYYANLEVIVVNDGSKDDTLAVLVQCFDLVPVHPVFEPRIRTKAVKALYRSRLAPNLVVVDKENGGKADALNVALNFATAELVCSIDADTLIEPDALQRMVRPFLDDDDVVAAGGTIRVANGATIIGGRLVQLRAPRDLVACLQVVEYLRAFLFGRLGWNALGGNLIISGAFGLFRRDAVRTAGGYVHDTVGEDMELVLRLRRQGFDQGGPRHAVFVPDPVAWTEVPESLRVLGRQRDRWHRGLADVLWRHRRVLFNPHYGMMGMVAFPYFVFVELLAPVVEAIGLVGTVVGLSVGAINAPFALLYFLLAYGYGILLSMLTLLLEELSYHRYTGFRDRLRLARAAFLENVGYRQVTVVWRLRGLVKYLRGKKDWGAMERRGLSRPAAAPPVAPGSPAKE
ncbi:MAG: glycosyltransferase family 2 protein [Gemmatimonadaceae bacterium]|nr:glycosyltransferase family 2 protein [Gemmatimonadaceae bacterium]